VLRIDDSERIVEIGVHDLIETGPKHGHLSLQVAWSARTRMRAGQEVHTAWQSIRADEDDAFRREVTLKRRIVVRDWECRIQGRVDGLSTEGDHTVVEEVKSTTLTAEMLASRTLSDFPDWARQVHLYLWFLAGEGRPAVGRLVLISLLDGSQRVLHVAPDPTIGDWVVRQLEWLLIQHEDRMAWRARRRGAPVPFPHDTYRTGQEALVNEITEALAGGRRLLLQAPTGYGKTAAALHAALTVARDTGHRVFFATARTTQQRMAEDTVREMSRRGLPIRAVTLRARERVCLNEVVACRPDACQYAENYHDKVREADIVSTLWALGAGPDRPGVPPPDRVVQVAGDALACPFAVSLDLVASADVVIGDLN
jgi:DNA excision repair protein ERCC-2